MEPMDVDHASRIEIDPALMGSVQSGQSITTTYWEVGCSVPVRVLVNLFRSRC